MRKSREEAAESRRRILKEAARLYRERGFDGVGVAEIMEAAGMTHGGFYRHFPSKEALIAEAMAEAFSDSPLVTDASAAGPDLMRRYVELYLSPEHLDRPDLGCAMAAVGSEAAHIGGDVSRVFGDGVEMIVARIVASLGGPERASRADAFRLMSSLVGAVVIARAVGSRTELRDEVLDAVRADPAIARLISAE